jgi:nucleoside-diphosphate-sugar epimerase
MHALAHDPAAVAVTGGAGAIGIHFIRHVLTHTSLSLRVLVHRTPLPADLESPRVRPVHGNLLDSSSLERWLCPGAVIVHLAWSASMTRLEHRRSIVALTEAAAKSGIRRFVHCSTAAVAGRTRASVVTEQTICKPATDYERTKYEIETTLESAAAGRFPVAILRPTAVFGPGLRNLVSLIESLRSGRRLTSDIRSALFGRRRLHLVPVQTVVAALLFAVLDGDRGGADAAVQRYLVSADDEPDGDFRAVEQRIRRVLDLEPRVTPVTLPPSVLRLLLWLRGRSDRDLYRVYDGSRLQQAGFRAPISLGEAIERYVTWYGSRVSRHGMP